MENNTGGVKRMRTAFIETLTEMARKDEQIVCVIGDTGFSVFEGFEKEFKERFVNVGIAEQNFVSFGAGLAAMGMKPYLYNVASFMTLRATEQILLDVCYQENPVVLIGVGGGHAYAVAGPTHHANQDIAIMCSFPNITVVCPGDPVEMKALMLQSADYHKPMYIRIGRSVNEVIHKKEIDFQIGKAIPMRDGADGVLFATGVSLKDAVRACSLLEEKDIHLSLYSMHTIKPFDKETVIREAERNKNIFTLEEHSKSGGLGTAVVETLAEQGLFDTKVTKFGVEDKFAPCTGTQEYLNKLYGFDAESVATTIYKVLKENGE